MSQFPPPPAGGQYPQHDQTEQGAPGIAIAALVCGILGIVLFFIPLIAIAAFILGIIGLNKISNGQAGRGMATAGVVLGAIGSSLGIIILLIAILLPALGAARRTARRIENSTQLRGIHQGLITYANSNKNNYAGLDTRGQIVPDGALTGNSGDGNTPQARMWMLLDGQFFTAEYVVSPSESDPGIAPNLAGGPVTPDHYSYALLQFEKDAPVGNLSQGGGYSVTPGTAPRAGEWKQTLNSQAIVISDRNTGTNTGTAIQSVHTDTPGEWRGSVLWNDNHVGFENAPMFATKYANGPLHYAGGGGTEDHLFIDEPVSSYNQLQGANALMVHE